MSQAGHDDSARELARGLGQALEPVCGPRVDPEVLHAAREVAELLSLPGLDRLLATLEPHAGRRWPHELSPVLDRLSRLLARCVAEDDPEAFRRADTELGALAAQVESLEWSVRGHAEDTETAVIRAVPASEALADLPIDGRFHAEVLAEARMTAPCAAALRAALDWITGEGGPSRPLTVSMDEGVLEIGCIVRDPSGLAAAHAVLAPVGGQIGPWLAEMPAVGRWVLRVPLIVSRPLFLMIEQNGLKLALPWASVLRVMMLPDDEIEERAQLLAPDIPLLPPLSPLAQVGSERPVVMIASGLLRGLIVADRLVWRLGAVPAVTDVVAPVPLHEAVRGDDGEIYWVADPAVLLAPLPLPPLATPGSWARRTRRASEPSRAVAPAPEAPPVLESAQVDALPVDESTTPQSSEGSVIDAQAPSAATSADPAASIAGDAETVTPSHAATSANDAPPSPAPAADAREQAAPVESLPANTTPRALIIEDSITARIFLSRMLEARGFETCAVAGAAEGLHALAHGPWHLVLADVELTDVRGAGWLRMLQDRAGSVPLLAALVRDADDRREAHTAGISRVLRKPFDDAEVDALIGPLMAARGRAS